MPLFKVTCHVKVPFVTHIEAESEEEAKKIALERDEPFFSEDKSIEYFKKEYWVAEEYPLFHTALKKEPFFVEPIMVDSEEDE